MIIGNAAITWSASSESVSERVFLLAAPLRQLKHGRNMEAFQRESLDRKTVENTVIGDGAPEITGTIRYGRDPGGMMDMLQAGSAGKKLTYLADVKNWDDGIECTLIAPLTPTFLRTDPQRGVLGDQSVELVLRPTSSGQRPERLIHGSNVRWLYRAGGHLEGATFSRDSTEATVRTPALGGTFAQASSDVARVNWRNLGDAGQPHVPTLLLEPERDNLLVGGLALSSTDWTATASGSASSGQDDPFGGTDAFRVIAGATSGGIEKTATLTNSSGFISLSVFLRQSRTDASTDGASLVLLTSSGGELIRSDIVFVDGEPSVTPSTSGVLSLPDEPSQGGWWRFHYVTTAEQTTGDYTVRIIGANGSTGQVDVFLPQVELGQFPTSPILSSTSGTKTRGVDLLQFQFDGRVRESTAYLKFIEIGAVKDQRINSNAGCVLHIGETTNPSEGTAQYLRINATSSGGYQIKFQNSYNHQLAESLAVESALGTEVELLGHFFADGSIRLTQVNEGALTQSDRSSGVPYQQQWSNDQISIGNFDLSESVNTEPTAIALQSGFFADGIIDVEGCRTIVGDAL